MASVHRHKSDLATTVFGIDMPPDDLTHGSFSEATGVSDQRPEILGVYCDIIQLTPDRRGRGVEQSEQHEFLLFISQEHPLTAKDKQM